MKTYLLVFLLVILQSATPLCAQTLPYSVFTTDKNLSFQKVITSNDGKMLVIFGREKWMQLCDYLWIGVHETSETRSREIKIIPDKSRTTYYFKDAISTNDGMWFVFYNYIKSKHSIEVILIPFDITNGKLLYSKELRLPQIDANAVLNGTFYLFQSPDKNKLGVLTVSGLLDDYKKKFYMCSVNLLEAKIHFSLNDYLPADAHLYQLLKPLLDNNGQYYVLAKRYKEAGFELTNLKSNYFYVMEHFENNLVRRSTGIYSDEDDIVRYPDALVKDDTTIQLSIILTDTTLVHPERVLFRRYRLNTHDIVNDTMLILHNYEPRINSSFVSETFNYNNHTLYTASGQYLEDVVGARLSHAYDVIKTYSVLANLSSLDARSIIIKTPARLRESQDFMYALNNDLHYITFAPGNNDLMMWSSMNSSTLEVSNSYSISNQVWKKNLPYFFASCANKPVVLQSINSRYQLIYLP